MNILDKHLEEVQKAQVAFDQGLTDLHKVYSEAVRKSRAALFGALLGDGATEDAFERLDTVAARVLPALSKELTDAVADPLAHIPVEL